MGVTKPNVTQQAIKPNSPTPTPPPTRYTQPSYNSPPPVAPPKPMLGGTSNTSTFVSSLGGALVGTAIGSMLFNNNHGGTTIVNTGGAPTNASTSAGAVGMSALPADGSGVVGSPSYQQIQPPYGVWGFIKDLIGFCVLLVLIAGIAFMIYKIIQKARQYFNKKSNVVSSTTKPTVDPTVFFWDVQRTFAAADTQRLQQLIGPDMIDQVLSDIKPSAMSIRSIDTQSVLLDNSTEYSVQYTFTDGDDIRVNQVWHYELFDNVWKLNGIENI